MKLLLACVLLSCSLMNATTISVVPIHEPISLHGTDVDEIISDTGEALQAAVLSRPMALTGAFPEVLMEAIRTPHKIPTNNPNYLVAEANLLVLCQVGIGAVLNENGLTVSIDVSNLSIPPEVDLTSRQLLKLTLVAIRRTLEEYQRPQADALPVSITISGTTEKNVSLKDLEANFTLQPNP